MTILDPVSANHLVRRLLVLRPETPARWGKMNAHQMVCHLSDSFDVAMDRKHPSQEVTFFNRTVIRWFALHVPIEWPKGVPTRPELDHLTGAGLRPGYFANDVDALRVTIRRFSRAERNFDFGRHPTMGNLSEWEWLRWAYLHCDHHLRQFGIAR